MCDSDLELNKYSILMITVIFKGVYKQTLKNFHWKWYHSWPSTSLPVVESATFLIIQSE